jgi:hypothetical protein
VKLLAGTHVVLWRASDPVRIRKETRGRTLEVPNPETAVNDSSRVRSSKAGGDLKRVLDRGSTLRRDMVPQGRSIEELGDDERHALFDTAVEDGEDIRVRQHADGPRLLRKTSQPLRVESERLREDLDGDVAVDLWIVRAIHLSHATGTEGRDDLVSPEARAGTDHVPRG